MGMGRTASRRTPERGFVVVDLEPVGRRAEVPAGTTLLDAARLVGVELQAVCGGAGSCGGCAVRVVEGDVSSPSADEREELSRAGAAAGLRLACRAQALADVRLDIPPDSLTASQRLQLESADTDPAPDATDAPPSRLGLAIDVGTTKVALFLLDLDTGATVARRGVMNPQIAYGEDVVSRIAYADRHADGSGVLRRRLAETLNRTVAEMCRELGVGPERVVEGVVVANTVMHHLFAGLPVRALGTAPYRPAVTASMALAAATAGLALSPGAMLYMPPIIAGYVGADHVAMLLAAGVGASSRTTLAIDIGTNTEISLAASGRIVACSSPSGPAFEGAHITAGMRAAPGAIERVFIGSGGISLYTIGRRPPIGICGSGILDAVAEMRRVGLLDRRGNLAGTGPGIHLASGRPRLVLAPAASTGHGRDIVVTRGDVNEIQLAKAAIRAAIEVLLAEAGISSAAVDEVVVAGAFGSYLAIPSAIRIGLFPDLSRASFRQIGNAAGAGARRMLRRPEERGQAEELARRVEHIELAAHPAFHRGFVSAMEFDVS